MVLISLYNIINSRKKGNKGKKKKRRLLLPTNLNEDFGGRESFSWYINIWYTKLNILKLFQFLNIYSTYIASLFLHIDLQKQSGQVVVLSP